VSLADLAQVRRGTYGLLSSLFLYQQGSDVDSCVQLARDLTAVSKPLSAFPFYGRLQSVLESLAEMTEEGAARLEEEYVDLFVLSVSHPPCALNESAYVDRTGRKGGVVVVDVERAYAAAGMALSPSAGGELPDHVALELDFLSHLCGQEAQAWQCLWPENATGILGVERRFLDRHLLSWFPAFVRRVSIAANPAGIYGELVEVAHAFVVHDRDLIGMLEPERAMSATVALEP